MGNPEQQRARRTRLRAQGLCGKCGVVKAPCQRCGRVPCPQCGRPKVAAAAQCKGCYKPTGRPELLPHDKKHGHAVRGQASPTYKSWCGMINRCTNPRLPEAKYYIGRGITVTPAWLKFENFLADMGERPEGKSIDRIDNNGNYEPGNCRWATWTEQGQNKRNVKLSFETAVKIMEARLQGFSLNTVARIFGCHRSNISNIARGDTWKGSVAIAKENLCLPK